jgi:hypothetical protein
MPEAALKVLGPYNEECDEELICGICSQEKIEEELKNVLLIFAHPEDPELRVEAILNMCDKCRDDIINNATANRIKDTFSNS